MAERSPTATRRRRNRRSRVSRGRGSDETIRVGATALMNDADDIVGESSKFRLEPTDWALPCEECGHVMQLFRNWMAEPQPAWDGWCLNLRCRFRGIVGRAA